MTSVQTIAADNSNKCEGEYAAHQLQIKIEKKYSNFLKIINMHNRIVVTLLNSTIPHLLFQQLEEP